MYPDLKERWIAALESGEFHWHKGALSNSEGTAHCCLGVLCEVLEYQRDDVYYCDRNGALVMSEGDISGTDDDESSTLADIPIDRLHDLVIINDCEAGAETYAPQVEYIKSWL